MLQFCSVSNSPLTDNTFRNHFEPFQIKWEVYFSKELCPLVFIVLNMFLHAYVLCGYATETGGDMWEFITFLRILVPKWIYWWDWSLNSLLQCYSPVPLPLRDGESFDSM